MAETAEETRRDSGEEAEEERRPPERDREHGNRIVWWVIVVLVIIFVVGGALGGKKSSSAPSPVNRGMRLLVVPTADAARTVVVPPCNTGTQTASANVSALLSTTGTTAVTLPAGGGVRVVLVPACGTGKGATLGASNLPSAAFVTKPGTPVPPVRPGSGGLGSPRVANPRSAEFQLIVPNASAIRTVVVPPCVKDSGPASRILAPAPGSTTAVAPAC